MAEEMKKLNSEQLEKIDGGDAAAFATLKNEVGEMIPPEVREKLRASRGSNVVTCRILAQNGIDVEKIEKKINDAGINLNKICLKELPDEALDKISGGSAGATARIVCRCGNADRKKMSWQVIDSFLSTFDYDCDYDMAYRCELCNTYILVLKNGSIAYE